MEQVQKLPEANDLVFKVLQEGPLHIQLNTALSDQFAGYWSFFDRTIYITKANWTTDCSMVWGLIFELNNALRNSDLKKIAYLALDGKIERGAYIKAIESIEYESALSSSALMSLGIERGIFPNNCKWNVAPTFQEHLSIEQDTGHSESIGRVYDEINGFNLL